MLPPCHCCRAFKRLPSKAWSLALRAATGPRMASTSCWAMHISASQRAVLTDPQTSGGLLVSCRPEVAAQVLEIFARHGFGAARVIGTMQAGPAQVQVQ